MLWEQYKTAAKNDHMAEPGPGGWWYHHAPTTERDRIRQHGLVPSNPNLNEQWGNIDQQPHGVYLFNSPSIQPLFTQLNERVPLDQWRVPAEGLEVHPDPIVWENAVYSPQHIRDPELFRPYEKSNEYQQQYGRPEEQFHSGPVPEDWVNYHDWHELGNPSDEEWQSYGIGQPTDTWKQAATLPPDEFPPADLSDMGEGEMVCPSCGGDGWGPERNGCDECRGFGYIQGQGLFHAAPTQDRDRIMQHGLQMSSPRLNDSWKGMADDQPEGVYMTTDPEATVDYGDSRDIWKVDPKYIENAEADRLWGGGDAYHVPHSIPPQGLTLHQGPEHNYTTKDDIAPYKAPQWVTQQPLEHPEWGIGMPDRVIGSQREADLFHVAPTEERDRINTWGLQPADPYYTADTWEPTILPSKGWGERRPPAGVYGWPTVEQAQNWRGNSENMDIWRVPGEGLSDPDHEGAQYIPHAVEPELHQGPEQRFQLAGTSPKPWEAKMFHGKPSSRGIMGPVRSPFWTTSFEDEAHGFAGDGGSVHPVSVRFHNPIHYFANVNWGPGSLEDARQRGGDGAVVHWPADERDPSDPYPARTWAIALDPGTVVPGHLKDSVTD